MVVSANLKLVRLSQVARVPAFAVAARRTSMRDARDVTGTCNCEDVLLAPSCVSGAEMHTPCAQSFPVRQCCCGPEESPGFDYFESLSRMRKESSARFRL